ncbi:hypothetical protein [Halegenticoccus soli]|uniref:hypothetical protein n=1 Tax=Halegenticoccus soli TaxID=1985678 RepID=UPI000C6CE13C|nr:hypothetical protein [Halegenticoccus soli]
MAVTLPADVLERYRRFSLYNSPYPAHDRGCAIDLYPETNEGISPVAGEVLDARTVRCPDRPYAVDHDHLILIDADERCAGSDGDGYVARVLHVDPVVEPGDRVEVGDPLGEMVRSGFFGQWVDNHVHLGFRERGRNAYRAAGSLPVDVDAPVEPLPWDGTGTVVETGPTHAVLDSPVHPAPGEWFAGIAADDGTVLDGGLAHYGGGGALASTPPASAARRSAGAGRTTATGRGDAPGRATAAGIRSPGAECGDSARELSLLGTPIGVAEGRDVTWRPIDVLANGERVTGISLFAARDAAFGAKLVAPDHDLAVGDEVEVSIRPSDDPIRLGGR